MKYFVSIVILYGASFATSSDSDEDKWSWGYVNEDNNEPFANSRSWIPPSGRITRNLNNDPCERYNPERPSFKAPGRRISEEKCEELLWHMRLNDEQRRREKQCEASKIRNVKVVPAVVGGVAVLNAGKFPHMGALGWMTSQGDYVFKCGSTLISSKFVMTAAHCTNAPVDDFIIDSHPKIVRFSNPLLYRLSIEKSVKHILDHAKCPKSNGLTDENIIRIIVHQDFKSPKKYYDIALLEMENDVAFNAYLKPACLWTQYDVSLLGSEAAVTGWGVLRFGSREASKSLQSANLNFIDSEQCDQLLYSSRNRNFWGLMEHQLCAGNLTGGVDACQGDSGGPLQVAKYRARQETSVLYYVVGVTSFGIGCAQPDLPGVYTRVSSFIDWIERHVWK